MNNILHNPFCIFNTPTKITQPNHVADRPFILRPCD